jgi:hypothetical protein
VPVSRLEVRHDGAVRGAAGGGGGFDPEGLTLEGICLEGEDPELSDEGVPGAHLRLSGRRGAAAFEEASGFRA